jgi:hypothetical protein
MPSRPRPLFEETIPKRPRERRSVELAPLGTDVLALGCLLTEHTSALASTAEHVVPLGADPVDELLDQVAEEDDLPVCTGGEELEVA